MFVANWNECCTQELIICVLVFMQAILPQKSN